MCLPLLLVPATCYLIPDAYMTDRLDQLATQDAVEDLGDAEGALGRVPAEDDGTMELALLGDARNENEVSVPPSGAKDAPGAGLADMHTAE